MGAEGAFAVWSQTTAYRTAAAWALYEPETDGALWDAFEAGYRAARAIETARPMVSPVSLAVFGALISQPPQRMYLDPPRPRPVHGFEMLIRNWSRQSRV